MLFSNFSEHPSNSNYVVFMFKTHREAIFFEDLLTRDGIWFEKDDSGTEKHAEQTYFAVRVSDQKRVMKHNFMTSAEYRKPFLEEPFTRFLIVGIGVAILTFAVVGFIVSNGESSATQIENVENQP